MDCSIVPVLLRPVPVLPVLLRPVPVIPLSAHVLMQAVKAEGWEQGGGMYMYRVISP